MYDKVEMSFKTKLWVTLKIAQLLSLRTQGSDRQPSALTLATIGFCEVAALGTSAHCGAVMTYAQL